MSLVCTAPIIGLAPGKAHAQDGRVYRVGILETVSADRNHDKLDALLRGLRERGYVEGQNLRIEYRSADGRAERFLETTLLHPPESFDAMLVWDLLDYLDGELVSRLVTRITSLIRDGGVVFAIFHSRKPEGFHRYRVIDAQNLELIPTPCAFSSQRVFQNREISDLFRRFRSSRTFVGRDQLREGLFVK